MVASHRGATDLGAGRASHAPAELLNNELLNNKSSRANCGPMTQQGSMGAHGHEMHPQGFVRLIGCHESSRRKDEAAPRLHA